MKREKIIQEYNLIKLLCSYNTPWYHPKVVRHCWRLQFVLFICIQIVLIINDYIRQIWSFTIYHIHKTSNHLPFHVQHKQRKFNRNLQFVIFNSHTAIYSTSSYMHFNAKSRYMHDSIIFLPWRWKRHLIISQGPNISQHLSTRTINVHQSYTCVMCEHQNQSQTLQPRKQKL